ncbi:MAG: hypothetical protein LBU82_06500 [Treponema sp.]|jgi:hypothetical protein|nr:hypothetical protein [Treponema sp.]
MQKAGIALILLLLSFPILLYAQEEDDSEEEPSADSEWDYYETEFYSVGDKTFIVSAGAVFPTVFFNNGNKIVHNLTPPVGYTGSLAYTFFLGSNVFIGGEIQGMVLQTLSRNMLFVIPIGARVGYQFVLSRFEFPISLALGMTFHRYLDLGYYGFYIKGGGGAYFRFNADWSFGFNASWGWYPEWTPKKNESIDGNIVDVMLSIRYHF